MLSGESPPYAETAATLLSRCSPSQRDSPLMKETISQILKELEKKELLFRDVWLFISESEETETVTSFIEKLSIILCQLPSTSFNDPHQILTRISKQCIEWARHPNEEETDLGALPNGKIPVGSTHHKITALLLQVIEEILRLKDLSIDSTTCVSALATSLCKLFATVSQPQHFKRLINVVVNSLNTPLVNQVLLQLLELIAKETPQYTLCFPIKSIQNQYYAAKMTFERFPITIFEGLTISTWISPMIEKDQKVRSHVVSLICDSFVQCSIILLSRNSYLVEVKSKNDLLAKKTLRLSDSDEESCGFQHVSLGMSFVATGGAHLKVQVTVGSAFYSTDVSTLPKISSDQNRDQISVIYGSSMLESETSETLFELTNIFGFKGVLSPSSLFTLHALGPSLRSLCSAASTKIRICSAKILSPSLLRRHHTRPYIESVLAEPQRFITALQRSVHFFMPCETPNIFQFVGRSANVQETDKWALNKRILLPISYSMKMVATQRITLDESLEVAGGFAVFTSIYALAVDHCARGIGDSSTQLIALRLLLQYSRRWIVQMCGEFPSMKDLLSRILFAGSFSNPIDRSPVIPRAYPEDEEDAKAEERDPMNISDIFINHCYRRSVDGESSFIVLDPELLISLIERPSLWTGEHKIRFWVNIMKSISDSFEDSQFSDFNMIQWKNVNLLHRLLLVLHELTSMSFCCQTCSSIFSEGVTEIVPKITDLLIGDQVQIEAVKSLWTFILHSHPPEKTFIKNTITSYHDWLRTDFPTNSEEFPYPVHSTDLCEALRRYYDELCTPSENRIKVQWEKGMDVIELRRLYHAHHPVTDSEDDSLSSQSMPSSLQPQFVESPGVNLLRAALIEQLVSVLRCGPDQLIFGVLHDVIGWQSIVVLLNRQTNPHILSAVMRLVECFLHRSPDFTKAMFIKFCGGLLIANQLRGMGMTEKIADAAFGIMLGEPVLISHGLDGELLSRLTVNQLNCDATHIVLAVLSGSTHLLPLFARITNSIGKVFEYNSQLQAAFIDSGIIDVMVDCLRQIAISKDYDEEFRSAMRDIWKTLAQKILEAGVLYSDERVFKGCRRFVILTCLLDHRMGHDWQKALEEDPDSLATFEAHQAFIEVRRCLCTVLNEWIQRFWSLKKDSMKSASAPSSQESLNEFQEDEETNSLLDDWSVVDGDLNPQMKSSDPMSDVIEDDSVTPSRATLLDGTSPMAAFVEGQFADIRQRMTKLGIVAKNILKTKYKKREKPAGLAHPNRISERVIFGLDTCLALFSFFEMMDVETREEVVLLRNFLTLLISAFSAEGSMREMWKSCTANANSKAKKTLSQLAAFVVYPSLEYRNRWLGGSGPERNPERWMFQKRALVLSALVRDLSDSRGSLRSLLRASMDDTYTMCLGVIDLALLSGSPLETVGEDCSAIQAAIKNLNEDSPFDFFRESRGEALKSFADNEKLAAFNYENERSKMITSLKLEAESIRNADSEISSALATVAMKLTTEVVEQTTSSRKALIEAPRELIRNLHTAEDQILQFESRLFHPLAPLHNASNWPNGYQLDQIEGPNRERKRMIPTDYEVDSKHFNESPGSSNLRPNFEAIMASGSFRRRKDELTVIDSYKYHCDVIEVRAHLECEGDLVVAEKHVHLLPRKTRTTHKQIPLPQADGFRIPYTQITEIWERKFLLRDIAFEIFVKDGPARLIVFENTKVRSTFQEWLTLIGFAHVFPDPKKTLQIATEQWRHGVMNNFGYLMLLNKIAGRTYNDLMQYPVFPFILSQYTMPSLDLANSNNYRNLSRPMAIQDQTKVAYYAKQYAQLEEADLGDSLKHGPYHYGSHYSNSGIVSHFLVRLMPFTKLALEYQDGRFDLPDRLFNSIESVWRLSSSESTTDFKELIPEFFYQPEFLQNLHHLNLGVRQNWDQVNDVMLPPWAPPKGYRLFTLINRQALESSYVVSNLHHWIDLIFGFKQSGKAAKEAMNVFHPLTHVANIAQADMGDEVDRGARATIIRTYGQMPTQLFSAPHQPHLTPSEQWGENINGIPCSTVENIRWGEYHRASRDRVSSLTLLPDGMVMGAANNMVIALGTAKELKAALVVGIFCLPTPSSGLIRFRVHMVDKHVDPHKAWVNAIDIGGRTVTAMAYSNFGLLFIGFSSGVISVYEVDFDEEGLHSVALRGQLLAHSSAIHTICVCDEYSSVVTGCSSGQVVLWDRNGLSFIRLITKAKALSALLMNRVSGDIAIVTPTNIGSRIQLYTINGDLVNSLDLDCIVTSVLMTELPEGTAVNALYCGCSDGTIRLLDLWGVRQFGTLCGVTGIAGSGGDPVIGMLFSGNHRRLFVARQSGVVTAWRSERDNALSKTVSFMHITAYRDPI
ncbi:unnamed protein product, partial [Mesorhabditis belari]|uniref:Uncharacterized protein n=1 Tax=Mesorhabditis belari TaxID=2138241 RepID=A0AAF3JBY0_9BILA